MSEHYLTTPLSDEAVEQLRIGDTVYLTGVIYTGRDAAHKRLVDAFGLLRGVEVPDELTDEPLDDLPYIELFYQWMNRAGYSLMKTTNASTVKGETGSRTRSAAEGEHRTGEDFRAQPGP